MIQSRGSTPEILYTGPVHSKQRQRVQKKVRVKSAAAEDRMSKQRRRKPVPIAQRPKWGGKAQTQQKVPLKQSERDPFYEKKQKRAAVMKTERAAELRRQAEANQPRIPHHTTISSRARSRSPPSEQFMAEALPPDSERSIASSPRSRHISTVNMSHFAGSPPVPSIKHRIVSDDPYEAYQSTRVSSRVAADTQQSSRLSRYVDSDPLQAPTQNGDFVPFVRSNIILDPAHATDPLPMSREPTRIQRGRVAYHQEHDPGRYGRLMQNFDESRVQRMSKVSRINSASRHFDWVGYLD